MAVGFRGSVARAASRFHQQARRNWLAGGWVGGQGNGAAEVLELLARLHLPRERGAASDVGGARGREVGLAHGRSGVLVPVFAMPPPRLATGPALREPPLETLGRHLPLVRAERCAVAGGRRFLLDPAAARAVARTFGWRRSLAELAEVSVATARACCRGRLRDFSSCPGQRAFSRRRRFRS